MERRGTNDPVAAHAEDWIRAGDWVAEQLRQSLQVLAAEAQEQVDHFHPGSDIISELVTDYNHFAETIFTYWILSPNQALQLKTLKDYFQALDDPATDDFWTVKALYSDPRWNEVRRLAKHALSSLEWPMKEREDQI